MEDIIQKLLVQGDATSAISMYRDLTMATNVYRDAMNRLEAAAKAAGTQVTAVQMCGTGIGAAAVGFAALAKLAGLIESIVNPTDNVVPLRAM